MGNLLQDQEKFEQALDCYCKVLQIAPDHFDACNNLGKTLQDLNRNEEALTHYQKALAMRPDNADALYNLGNVFKEQGHLTQAIEYYRLALRQKPDYVEVHNNMGNAFQKAEYFETAVKCYQQALRYKPQYAVAWNNLGKTFQELGRLNEAKMACNQALLYDSQNPEAHFNHAIALLLNAELEKGWNEYEWRFLTDDWQNIYPYRIDLPRWQGESFAGQKLFVHSEQGLGDTLQFIRYLPWVKSKGGLVIFETMKSLHPILQNYPGIDQLVEMSTRPNPTAEFDIYIPLLSLPGVFQSNLDTIPDAVPYIQADKSLAERWRDKFTTTDFKVGLVWAGKPSHKNDHNRSISPEQFIPLSRIDSLSLYGLQKGKAATQFAGIKNRFPIQNLGQSLQNFADTAAVVANLDLVISVDTSVAHLAGAMGKAVWTLLPYIPDWRWMMDREDSPWYPTMRLFRQPQRGNWDAVIQRVAEELKKLLEGG